MGLGYVLYRRSARRRAEGSVKLSVVISVKICQMEMGGAQRVLRGRRSCHCGQCQRLVAGCVRRHSPLLAPYNLNLMALRSNLVALARSAI